MMGLHRQTASLAERRKALHVGVSVLQANYPRNAVHCIVFVAPNEVQATASIDREGVVRVANRHTGALIAQSMPAPLAALDMRAFDGANIDGPPDWMRSRATVAAVRDLAADLLAPEFRDLSAAELSSVLSSWADQLAVRFGLPAAD